MADKSDKNSENRDDTTISLLASHNGSEQRKSKLNSRREKEHSKKKMTKSKKKKLKKDKSCSNSENHDTSCHDVYELDNGNRDFIICDQDQKYKRGSDTDQFNSVSDWNRNVSVTERHRNEYYSETRFVSDRSRNSHFQRTVYNNSFHNDSATHFKADVVDRNREQVLYQENLRFNEELNNSNQQWPSFLNNEVEIIFRRKELQKKLLPVLQDIIEGLVAEKFSVEDLRKFLASYSYSSPKNNRQSPEGDPFLLDISSIPDPDANSSIPKYERSFSEIMQPEDKTDKNEKSKMPKFKVCFNCSEDHILSECPYKIDQRRVAAARKRTKTFFPQNIRYHAHGSKESDFKPGMASDDLRNAMALKHDQIPLYIYQMRVLGYPPGWLAEAAVESSGITVYGSDGNAEIGRNSEEGEMHPASTVQYDPDKLIDFPGFNVVLPSSFVDEADKLGYPPIHFQDLRCVLESFMAKPDVRPKRKREVAENKPFKIQRCEEDMEMDEGSDEEVRVKDYKSEFVPPLPIETLPPPPPDDPPLPPEDEAPPLPTTPPPEEEFQPPPPGTESPIQTSNKSSAVHSLGLNLSLSECWKNKHFKEDICGTSSPSLTELEEIKKRIVMELKNEPLDEDALSDDTLRDKVLATSFSDTPEKTSPASSLCSLNEPFVTLESSNDVSTVSEASVHSKSPSPVESSTLTPGALVRSESRTSKSKFMTLGTPSLSRHSSYSKLPDYEQFSKNVTSHMNFENLPNSTGTFQKLKGVLKRVKEKMKFM